MRYLFSELRQSWRMARRSPGLTAAAVVALAMGIGFTTTMFGILHGGTRSLPFDQPDELVAIVQRLPRSSAEVGARAFELRRWREGLTSLEGLAAYRPASVNLSGASDRPRRVPSADVSPETFDLLGVAPILGRSFGPTDAAPGAPRVALISHALWTSSLASDPEVLGREIRLDGTVHTVIGVMPPGFGFPVRARLWLPLAIDAHAAPGQGEASRVFGRLRDGVTARQATAGLEAVMDGLASEHPDAYQAGGARVFPFTETETPPDVRQALRLLVAVVSLVLLVACANVANLLLARAAGRSRDTAIRTALGATRGRLVAQQIAESIVLAAAATAAGLAMAATGLRFFAAASAGILDAFWVDFRIDATVALFAGGLGLAAALAAGLAPALRASSTGAGALIQAQTSRLAGPRIGRLGRALVVAQIALACGLLIVTATLVSAAGALRLVQNPFPADTVLTAQVGVLPATLDDPDQRRSLLAGLRDGLAAEPALRRAALASAYPGRGAGNWSFQLGDSASPAGAPDLYTGVVMVTPEFFDLAEARATRGRLLTWQDDASAPSVAVVNESFVRRFLGDRDDPIGRRLALGSVELTVVGVVPDLLIQDIESREADGIYVSMLQQRPFAVRVMAETAGPPLDAVPALRRAVEGVDPDLPLLEIASLHEAIFAEKRILDAIAALFFCFGAGVVFLAGVGLHALLSFVVTQRTREFGVRMALGASAGDILRLVLRRGGLEVIWGLGLGLALAAALSRLLGSALERVAPPGPEVFGAIAGVVAVAAALAFYRPVRRAVRLAPLDALRQD